MVNNLRALANMTSISEEVIEEVITQQKTPSKSLTPSNSTKESSSSGHKMNLTKDKLAKKIPGFKKRTSDNDGGDKGGAEGGKKGKDHEGGSKKAVSMKWSKIFGSYFWKEILYSNLFQDKKRGSQQHSELDTSSVLRPKLSISSSGAASTSIATPKSPAISTNTPTSSHSEQQQQFNNGVLQLQQPTQSADKIESMEQIEALIQMKKVPQDTVAIHSPESGTTIF